MKRVDKKTRTIRKLVNAIKSAKIAIDCAYVGEHTLRGDLKSVREQIDEALKCAEKYLPSNGGQNGTKPDAASSTS